MKFFGTLALTLTIVSPLLQPCVIGSFAESLVPISCKITCPLSTTLKSEQSPFNFPSPIKSNVFNSTSIIYPLCSKPTVSKIRTGTLYFQLSCHHCSVSTPCAFMTVPVNEMPSKSETLFVSCKPKTANEIKIANAPIKTNGLVLNLAFLCLVAIRF